MVDKGGRAVGGASKDGSEGLLTGGGAEDFRVIDSKEGLDNGVSLSCGWPWAFLIDEAVLLAEETLLIATEDDTVIGFSPRLSFNSTRRSPT